MKKRSRPIVSWGLVGVMTMVMSLFTGCTVVETHSRLLKRKTLKRIWISELRLLFCTCNEVILNLRSKKRLRF